MRRLGLSLASLLVAGLAGCATSPDFGGMLRDVTGKLGTVLTRSDASGFPVPSDPPAQDCDWWAAVRPGAGDDLAKACGEAVQARPRAARFRFHHGRALRAAGQDAGAIRAFQEALRLFPEYADVQNALGEAHEHGLGVTADAAEAIRWYRRAAHRGLASAEVNIGRMYRDGRGGEQNAAEAILWFQRAADQGNRDAEAALGAAGK